MSSKDRAPDSEITMEELCKKKRIRVLNALIEYDALPVSEIAHKANTSYQNTKKQIEYLRKVNLLAEEEVHGIPYFRLDKEHPAIKSLMRIKKTLEQE